MLERYIANRRRHDALHLFLQQSAHHIPGGGVTHDLLSQDHICILVGKEIRRSRCVTSPRADRCGPRRLACRHCAGLHLPAVGECTQRGLIVGQRINCTLVQNLPARRRSPFVEKQIKAKKVLFDSWYASWQNLKQVHRLGLIFYTTLKSNRLVSLSKESGYVHLDEIEWTAERLKNGVLVKLKKVPFKVKLFKVVAKNGDIDWVITNDLDETMTTKVVQEANDLRWQVEEFHRELKQLTGSEKCQCRKARSQRNHLACSYHAWLSLKLQAKALGKTIYRVRTDLFSEFLRNELRNPTISAFQPA